MEGFVSSPAEGRGNRGHQFFYVNGRYIKSALLQSAVEQAYRNTLLVGRYPSCVIYLKIGYGNVDVNVHPAKTEIRFGNEKAVFDFVYQGVKLALESEDRLAPKEEREETEKVNALKEEKKENSLNESVQNIHYQKEGNFAWGEPAVLHSLEAPYSSQYSLNLQAEEKAEDSKETAPHREREDKKEPFTTQIVEKPVQTVEKPQQIGYRLLGEAFHTYIILEQNEELILIDKHAAHERMIFDRLKKQERELTAQLLLMPAVVRLSPEDSAVLEENGALLTELGFEIEPYGEREYIVRGVPAEMNLSDVAGAIEEICEKLKNGGNVDPAAARDEVLHTVACKAAIKAGWDTQRSEEEKIAEAVLSGEIRYCPHGRPVSAVVTRRDLDKLFKRIV